MTVALLERVNEWWEWLLLVLTQVVWFSVPAIILYTAWKQKD